MSTNNVVYSSMVRAGRKTFFIDVKEAKDGTKYLQVVDHHKDVEDKVTRKSIRVYAESIDQFIQAVTEAAAAMKEA